MEDSDYLDLNGQQLQILLAIRKAGSLSAAARLLGLNQSTVSYWLDLMRKRMGDPLFVRAGNGVEPTERAKGMFDAADEALRLMRSMCERETYDPAEDKGVLRIGASSVERGILLAPLFKDVLKVAPGLSIELSPTGSSIQLSDRLRQGMFDLALMPEGNVEGEGIMQRTLFKTKDVVFFDLGHPLEEGDLDAYCERPHARIALGPVAGFAVDRRLAKVGRTRHVALQTADFDSALRMLKGTPVIATLPLPLIHCAAEGLGYVDPPWPQEEKPFALYWHARDQSSARNLFWRRRIAEILH